VEELCEAALPLSPGRRAAYLDRACAGDSALRREIESLLACEDRAARFLEVPAFELITQSEALPAPPPPLIPPGTLVGPYRIDAFLGGGGMGQVYRARDTRLDRDVALKFLAAEVARDALALARFRLEARAASALNHPNICDLHDIGEHGGQPYLVMEVVEGETLKQRLAAGPIPPVQIVDIALQVTSALEAAHAKEIVHRDIKPSNVLLTPSGQAKLLDFGLATGIAGPSEASEHAPSVPHAILGTYAYMSPEQARGEPVDTRADLFSLGVTLYQIATAALPFRRPTPPRALEASITVTPLPPRALNPALPRGLERIILRLIDADPSRRYQSASELRLALERLRASLHRPAWPLAAAAACLLLLLLAFGLRWWTSRSTPPPLTAIPLTSDPGRERHPSLSPDGSRVACAWDRHGNFDIFSRGFNHAEPTRLTTHPDPDVSPAWSPDGLYVAFLRYHSDSTASLLLIPASGGTERLVTSLRYPPDPDPVTGPYLAWMPGSRAILFSERPSPGRPLTLYQISVFTGERAQLTSPPPTSLGDAGPAVSPDGRHIAFLRLADVASSDIWVLTPPAPQPVRVTNQNRWITSLAWLPSSDAFVYSSGDIRTRRALWLARLSGAPPLQLPVPAEDCYSVASSPRSNRIVFTYEPSDLNVWRLDLPPSGEPRQARLIASTRREYQAHFSPAGDRIAFQSNRSGAWEIWVADADGSHAAQLTHFGGPMTGTPRWSPDGLRLAFDSRVDGQGEVFVIDAAGGSPRRVTHDPAEDIVPSWSTDGRWIYFASRRTGVFQVWKIPPEGGTPVQVTQNGGFGPRESLDGKTLYFVRSREEPVLWSVPVDGGAESQVAGRLQNWSTFVPAPDGLYFLLDSTRELRHLPSGRRLFTFTAPVHYGFSLSPGGRRLLYTQIDSEEADLLYLDLPR
jgi:serine/threonine protein kinase